MTDEKEHVDVQIRGHHEEMFGPHVMLPEVCLCLRMALNGAADPWPKSQVLEAFSHLKSVEANWEERSYNNLDKAIDDAVLQLVRAAIAYCENRVDNSGFWGY